MRLVRLQAESFRNLDGKPFVWNSGMNLLLGGNGEGKTNLLEAVVVLANLRSFRVGGFGAVIRHGSRSLRLEAEVEVTGLLQHLEQVVELGPPLVRTLRLNGRQVEVAEYLQCFPVFSMSSGDSSLVCGTPEVRRAFLDRLVFLLRPSHLALVRDWRRGARQRCAALARGASEEELAAWELRLAGVAARLVVHRMEMVRRLQQRFGSLCNELWRNGFPSVSLRYRGETWLADRAREEDLGGAYLTRLAALRRRDRERGVTSEGPHRHDLLLVADGRPARNVLSAGQVKIVASVLRLAALAEVEAERHEALPVVMDDADAELDAVALDQLLAVLGSSRQVFLSSSHDEVASRVGPAVTVWMRGGTCWRRAVRGEVA